MATWMVTGAGRGIGRALAERLLADGERVIATARRPETLAGLTAAHGDRLAILALDVTDPAAVAGLADRVTEPVDVLVNNAGVLLERNADTLSPALDWAAFEESFRVNAIAPLFVTRAMLPRLSRPGGKVVMITSGMGSLDHDRSDTTAYRASKAALNKITRALARDLAPMGVAVLAVHPGWVQTDMGTAAAAVPVGASAAGLVARIRALDLAGTGRFLNYDGSPLPW